MQETPVWSLSWEDPLEKGMATHFSILAWRTPETEEPGGLQSMGLQRAGHNWVTITFPPFFPPNNVMHWTHFTKQYYMHYLPDSTTQISSNMKINSSFTRLMKSRMRNKMLFAWLSVTCRSLHVSFVELTRPTTCSLSFPATLWWKLGWCFSLCLLHEYIGIHIQWLCECPMASER